MQMALSFEEAVSLLVSRVWEEAKIGRACVFSFVQVCGLITLQVRYNLLYILNVLYATY